jgi:hypothetical protein
VSDAICIVGGCPKKVGNGRRDMCSMHYARLCRSGDVGEAAPRYAKVGASMEERLDRIGWTVTERGCWEWKGHRRPTGYGAVGIGGRDVGYTHRVAYEIANGPIPQDMFVCHRCDNPPCINPDHLFLGSAGDNNRDMLGKGRHAFGERNGHAVLSNEDVQCIRDALTNGAVPALLAAEWGVTRGYIYGLRARRNRRIA